MVYKYDDRESLGVDIYARILFVVDTRNQQRAQSEAEQHISIFLPYLISAAAIAAG